MFSPRPAAPPTARLTTSCTLACGILDDTFRIKKPRPTTAPEASLPFLAFARVMWLLYTPRAELHQFQAGPEAVPGGFAILSHRWGEEQSFADLRALNERCQLTGENPRDHAHWKIRRFCVCAESWGHKWAWADMCCIDKSSSSELSEAINSMYRYYSLAAVCYAYLEDVPANDWSEPVDVYSGRSGRVPSARLSPFGRSNWHTRGWTLQELIAPRTVIFLSKEWVALGAKADHARLLNECTGIPEDILTLSRRPAHFSIAQRMSWAAQRTTTRLEDEAYCLIGIFDVNMPTLYGEGRRAFRRLQEEIMRRSVDPSLFAWGLQSPGPPVSEASSESTSTCPWDHAASVHLFAESPDDFMHSQEVSFDRPQHFGGEKWVRLGIHVDAGLRKMPTFTNTPFGVLANLLILRISGELYGMLLGRNVEFDPVVLELQKCLSAQDAPGDVYHPVRRRRLRPADVGTAGVDVSWQSIYISTDPAYPDSEQGHSGPILPQVSLVSPFHISLPHLLNDWMNVDLSRLHHPWDGSPPLKISVWSPDITSYLCCVVHLGRCTAAGLESNGAGARWAYVERGDAEDQGSTSPAHDCPGHHIDEWHNRTRIFPGVYRFFEWGAFWDDVEISFTESCLPVPPGCVKPLQPQLKIIHTSPHRAIDDATKSRESRLSAALRFKAGQAKPGGSASTKPAPRSRSVYPIGTSRRVDKHARDSNPSEQGKHSLSVQSHRRRRQRTDSDHDDSEFEQRTASRVDGPTKACAESSLTFPASSCTPDASSPMPLAGISSLISSQPLPPSPSGPGRAARKRPRRQ